MGGLLNITKDYATRSIWAYSERAVFKYKVNKEDRNVWQVKLLYLVPINGIHQWIHILFLNRSTLIKVNLNLQNNIVKIIQHI